MTAYLFSFGRWEIALIAGIILVLWATNDFRKRKP